jgi:hypothetical protein
MVAVALGLGMAETVQATKNWCVGWIYKLCWTVSPWKGRSAARPGGQLQQEIKSKLEFKRRVAETANRVSYPEGLVNRAGTRGKMTIIAAEPGS